MNHFNKSGYAIMTDKQREMVYGSGAPFENKLTLEAGRNLTMPKAKKALHTVLRNMIIAEIVFFFSGNPRNRKRKYQSWEI